jgi:putative DNA primase/helicase
MAASEGDVTKLDRQLAFEPNNDLGNARRLLARHGDALMHVSEVGWHAWDGRRWSEGDGDLRARRLAHETAEAIRGEATALEQDGCDAEIVQAHRKFASSCGNSGRVSNMLQEAVPYCTVEQDELDTDPWSLNLADGTLDLQTGQRRPHRPGDRITRVCPVGFDAAARAPVFERFLERVQPDPEMRSFIQRVIGYTATGTARDQVMFCHYGRGANGKSTLMDLVAWVLGDYSATVPFASLLYDDRRRGSEATPDLARLPRKRFVRAAEPDVGARFSESIIKQWTGGEEVTVRHLNQGFFDFVPILKLHLSFNNKPSVRGQDDGIWRRLILIDWPVTIPREERDPELPSKLRAEASGVLNWIIDGASEYLERGLEIPEVVRAATEDYKAENDPVSGFLAAAVARREGATTGAKTLFDAYERWCRDNGYEAMSKTMFGRVLGDKGYRKSKIGTIVYHDVELRLEFWPEAPGGGDI